MKQTGSLSIEPLQIRPGVPGDAVELAALHTAAAGRLTALYGTGPWSSATSEKSVLFWMRHAFVFVIEENNAIVATFHLAAKKPWAIDAKYFTKAKKPLYLLSMAVIPNRQRQGLGRKCLQQALIIAKSLNADCIRLDAYNAAAGAGPFYSQCGFAERGRVVYRNAPLIYYEHILST